MKKERFDFICSLGSSCLCATSLREAGLRLSSGPFDWLLGPSLKFRVDMVANDFAGWFEREDTDGLRKYYSEMGKITAHSKESAAEEAVASERLFKALKDADYDPSICCITVNDANVILDGFHRSAFLLARHGPDHKVKVVRVLPDFR